MMLLQTTTKSEFYSQIDIITKVLIESADGFNSFLTITRVLWGIFYIMLVAYVIFQSVSQRAPINFFLLIGFSPTFSRKPPLRGSSCKSAKNNVFNLTFRYIIFFHPVMQICRS
jgi:hypothetical protein